MLKYCNAFSYYNKTFLSKKGLESPLLENYIIKDFANF